MFNDTIPRAAYKREYYCERRDSVKQPLRILFCCIMVWMAALPASFATAAAPDHSLVLHWKLDGDFRDASGHNNHGTASGNVSFLEACAIGRCATFSGGYVQVPPSAALNLGGQFTVSLWLKLASDDAGRNPDASLVAKENTDQQKNWGDYQFRLKTQGTHDIIFFTAQMTNGFEPIGGTSGVGSYELHSAWSLVTMVFDGDEIVIYVNGNKESSSAAKDRDGKKFRDDTTGRLFVGALPGGKNPLDGAIDDLRIYKRALSAAEVNQLYTQR